MAVLGASVPVGLDDPRRIGPTFVVSGVAARRPETGPKRIFPAYRTAWWRRCMTWGIGIRNRTFRVGREGSRRIEARNRRVRRDGATARRRDGAMAQECLSSEVLAFGPIRETSEKLPRNFRDMTGEIAR